MIKKSNLLSLVIKEVPSNIREDNILLMDICSSSVNGGRRCFQVAYKKARLSVNPAETRQIKQKQKVKEH